MSEQIQHSVAYTNQSLRMLEHEDTTMLALIHEVDGQMGQMKSSVLNAVANIRNRILSQASETLTQQRVAAQDQQDALIAHTTRLQDLLDAKVSQNQDHQSTIERLVGHIQSLKQKARAEASMRKIFDLWREKSRKLALHKRNADSLSQTSAIHHLRSSFLSWRIRSETKKITAQKVYFQSTMQREVTKVDNDKQMLEAKWAMERLQLTEKLRVEEERRELLEQKLKAAFMRGVCALNMEAMSVLRGHDGLSVGDGPNTATTETTTQFGGVDALAEIFSRRGMNFDGNKLTGTQVSAATTQLRDNDALYRQQIQLQQDLLNLESASNNKENANHHVDPKSGENNVKSIQKQALTEHRSVAPVAAAQPSSSILAGYATVPLSHAKSSGVAKRSTSNAGTNQKPSPTHQIPNATPRMGSGNTTSATSRLAFPQPQVAVPQSTHHTQRHTGVEVKVTMNPSYCK